MTIENTGSEDRLTSARTAAAMRAEIHTHQQDANGVMKMIHLEDGLTVASGESVTLKRGGDHVMLMGLTAPLEQGGSIDVTLTFEKAGEVTVAVPVDLTR